MIEAKVVSDSISPDGVRLTTIEGTLHRFVLAELNTHGILARSAQSSRAVPVPKMIEMVRTNPALPVFWGANKPGMQATEECNAQFGDPRLGDLLTRETMWSESAMSASYYAEDFHNTGYHKQIVNRLLEPFLWQRVVITGTEWENFKNLRCHPDAQPEIRVFAEKVVEAMEKSTPNPIRHGDWHLPYVEEVGTGDEIFYVTDADEDINAIDTAKKYSAARCATTSFRTDKITVERAVFGTDGKPSIFSQLVEGDLPHCFDDKTEVLTSEGFKLWSQLNDGDFLASVDSQARFCGFKKPTKLIRQDYFGEMLSWDTALHSSCVTPNHRVLYKYRMSGSKKSDFLVKEAQELQNKPHYIPLKVSNHLPDREGSSYLEYHLWGFALGDGFVPKDCKNVLYFRFKKGRKIDAVLDTLTALSVSFRVNIDGAGVTNIQCSGEIPKKIANQLYDGNRNKVMPEDYLLLDSVRQLGLLDGLCLSDGTVKRSNYQFSSTSLSLAEGFYNLSLVLGVASCFIRKDVSSGVYVVSSRERGYAILNDPRKAESHCLATNYNGVVYCAEIEDNFLIVRRNGHSWISGNSVPTEHVARPLKLPRGATFRDDALTTHITRDGWCWSGRFRGWGQFRKEITGSVLTR